MSTDVIQFPFLKLDIVFWSSQMVSVLARSAIYCYRCHHVITWTGLPLL